MVPQPCPVHPGPFTIAPMPDPFRRHFLPWTEPWLPQVTAWLARNWDGEAALDLASTLALVPTRQAARRLREALADHAGRQGQAVFPPLTLTPDEMLDRGAAAADVASRLEALLAWGEVLREVDLAAFDQVYPVPPPQRDAAWAWAQAEVFHQLQTQLTEGGLGFADVVPRAGEGFPEVDRWRQLAALEELQVSALERRGRREPHAARRQFARAPALPPGIDRIAVLAVPDPLPLALVVLRGWGPRLPVDVVVYAPPGDAGDFDAAGRPDPARWERRDVELPDFAAQVRLVSDPAAAAAEIAGTVRRVPDPDGLVALGVADPEVLPLLENELTRAGVPHFNPETRDWRTHRLHVLLTALARLAQEPSSANVSALARCPDFLAALPLRGDESFSTARFLQQWDELRSRHLPADLDDARRFAASIGAEVAHGLAIIADLRQTLRAGGFPGGAVAALTDLFGRRRYDPARPGDARALAAAETWREVMRACAEARTRFGGLADAEWWDIALRLFGGTRRAGDKAPGALELQGWLELAWEDAPHLIVAGLNEGLVPDAIVGDAFLPESLRARLGLKTNAMRLARDACLLQSLAASRRTSGRLELLCAKNTAAGDPQRPSRLLLRGPDEVLPERIRHLFRPVAALQPHLAWTRAWRLRPRRVPPPAHVPVTGLRAWLACPFRFYLAHVLKLRAVDAGKIELDAFDFGTLCHAALEAMGREAALGACTDEAVLREFLLAAFERAARNCRCRWSCRPNRRASGWPAWPPCRRANGPRAGSSAKSSGRSRSSSPASRCAVASTASTVTKSPEPGASLITRPATPP